MPAMWKRTGRQPTPVPSFDLIKVRPADRYVGSSARSSRTGVGTTDQRVSASSLERSNRMESSDLYESAPSSALLITIQADFALNGTPRCREVAKQGLNGAAGRPTRRELFRGAKTNRRPGKRHALRRAPTRERERERERRGVGRAKNMKRNN